MGPSPSSPGFPVTHFSHMGKLKRAEYRVQDTDCKAQNGGSTPVLYAEFRIPCSVFRILYSVFRILYSVFCIPYSVFSILYSVFCILYSVFCTLYSVLCILYPAF